MLMKMPITKDNNYSYKKKSLFISTAAVMEIIRKKEQHVLLFDLKQFKVGFYHACYHTR